VVGVRRVVVTGQPRFPDRGEQGVPNSPVGGLLVIFFIAFSLPLLISWPCFGFLLRIGTAAVTLPLKFGVRSAHAVLINSPNLQKCCLDFLYRRSHEQE
jgi:hypothetical protein